MHHLCPRSRRHPSLSRGFAACQAQVEKMKEITKQKAKEERKRLESKVGLCFGTKQRCMIAHVCISNNRKDGTGEITVIDPKFIEWLNQKNGE
uniref:Uncharacterized protein n=1 Tax=Lactuca sativa TaxID=4236 RepID=A0A9R1VZE6_LACSA|nr:hypothetical protein LSAT_V11C400186120 [Lactuca sativa]